MPPLPSVSKVMRVDLFQTVGSDTRVRDRVFFQFSGAGPTVTDLNTLIATISLAWNGNISPLQDNNRSLTSVQITDLTSATGAQSSGGTARTGTRSGVTLTASSCAIIRFKIARRYRGGHPRYYLSCGVNTDQASPNTWSGAFITSVGSGWTAFINACEASPPTNIGTMTHVNVSYFTGFTNKTFPSGRTRPVPTLRGTPLVDTVLSYVVNPIIGNQRRRNLQSA